MAIRYYITDSDYVIYYAATNAQGDVLGLYTGGGILCVTYEYDSWGNLISMTDITSAGIGSINPIRYRGYYFDDETGLYYLQSRYYDPQVGRFINADGLIDNRGIVTQNVYLYCANNPVNMVDAAGEIAITTLIFVGSLVVGGIVASYSAYESRQNGYDWDETIFNAVIDGACAFMTAYTLGMSGYEVYCNMSMRYGYTPVTSIGPSKSSNVNYPSNDGYTMSKSQTSKSQKTFLPDEYYSNKKAPAQSTPNSSYVNYKYNTYTGKYEKSTSCYDFAGRQVIRVDWTNHGYSSHGNPHVHYTIYNSQYRDGITIRWD